jgi:site-specific DNA-adenine methylase
MIDTGKINFEQLTIILEDVKSQPNSELIKVMDFLNEDYEDTKDAIVKLTNHLDNIENLYGKVYTEYNSRTKV